MDLCMSGKVMLVLCTLQSEKVHKFEVQKCDNTEGNILNTGIKKTVEGQIIAKHRVMARAKVQLSKFLFFPYL